MVLKKVINPDFNEGVDRKQLKTIRDRFLKVNQSRLERTRQALPVRHQTTLDLLPMFFQVNHPLLPGYISHQTPRGVAHYAPDKNIIQTAQGFSRSFRYKEEKRLQPSILSLFMMGSIGTIAQSDSSDIDIWLCHRSDLDSNALNALRRKADLITEWAAETGLEVYFFLMDADHFKRRQSSKIDKESSGSAQHFLLLDEFYRTSVLLAGCYPLWWLIPPADEGEYKTFAALLTEKRFIRASEVIDFGGIANIPKEEFVGAGMWQLYKGIDAPYKSVLKLLLTEVYAQELPEQPNLSIEFKQAIYSDELDVNQLDPYVMIYRRLERYLVERGESARLELVRRSFYLKVDKRLSATTSSKRVSWQRTLLSKMVDGWEWSKPLVKLLDSRQKWRIPQVLKERKAVVNELTHSYRFLSHFARDNGLKAHINTEDMKTLGRKLYAVFQRKAGKVELINPGIAPQLLESNLAFHHQSSQPDSSDLNGWLLYRDLSSTADALFQPVLKRSTSIIELIAWCYFNGIANRNTRLSLVPGSSGMTMFELQHIIATFEQVAQYPLPAVPHDNFRYSSYPLHTILFVNVGVDPMAELSAKGVHKISDRNDSLGYSSLRDNLVLTLDQISINSWHELSVYRYEMGDTLIQCLKNYLASLVDVGDNTLPRLDVRCFCPNRAMAISQRVEALFASVVSAFFVGRDIRPVRYVIEMDSRLFVIQFFNHQPRFTGFENIDGLLAHLQQPQITYTPVIIDGHALLDEPSLRQVFAKAQAEAIQVFFQVCGAHADLYIVDEYGSLFSYRTSYHSNQSLLIPLYRFLTSILERRQLQGSIDGDFLDLSLEFYELVRSGKNKAIKAEKKNLAPEAIALFVDVQAIGHQDSQGNMAFDIYCDQLEFSVLEYGDQLMSTVAGYIQSKRQPGDIYPCYITDLGLPNDIEPNGYQSDLQSVQYLRYKQSLEAALNEALQKIV